MTYQILHGNNLDILPTLADNSIDSIVTDPPYELGFMGKKWDSSGIAYSVELWQQCLRVLKPGGHLLSFGGTRTYHRVAVAIEDAGFELRDSIAWLYGSGFPKSLDVSKAIDKQAGAEREVLGRNPNSREQATKENTLYESGTVGKTAFDTAPSTPEAQQWQGWGTALKPAFEPVIVARKPIEGNVANNVLKWGTGGLNIDGSRIGSEGGGTHCDKRDKEGNCLGHDNAGRSTTGATVHSTESKTVQGRWPANIILDPYTAELLDEQSGQTKGVARQGFPGGSTFGGSQMKAETGEWYGDSGGASRFFKVAVSEKQAIMNVCENTLANNVVRFLRTIQATTENTAQTSADSELEKKLAQAVSDAGIQCDLCATSIAQSLVELKTSGYLGSIPSLDSMPISKSSTLIQSLVLVVESLDSTDTTLITTNLLRLFGCVQDAIDESIKQGSLEIDKDLVRFLYQAKASKRDRNEGLEELLDTTAADMVDREPDSAGMNSPRAGAGRTSGAKNFHPTVKPTSLMEYLIKLVTPPNGIVLDPFTGSGSTGKAAILQGFNFIGIEMTEEYLPIIEGRLKHAEAKVAERNKEASLLEQEKLF